MTKKELENENRELTDRLQECEETLEAIRSGSVDALVIHGRDGEQVYTLKTAELPYRILVESMNEGALTLTAEGMILYSNTRFADMLGTPLSKIIGSQILNHIFPEDHHRWDTLLFQGKSKSVRDEIRLFTGRRASMPALFSIRPLVLEDVTAVSLVVTDITQQKSSEQSLRDLRDRLRSLAADISMSEEQERRRIAAFLHDRIGPTLSLCQFRLEVLQDSLNVPERNEDFEEIRGGITQAINETRTLTAQLYPPVLYGLGFSAAVDWLGEQVQREYGIRVTVTSNRSPHAQTNDYRGFLYHATRELIFNAVKHAEATMIQITIDYDGGLVRVVVEDDGKGFDTTVLENNQRDPVGFGLFSIRERLSIMGGDLKIVSHPGQGTRASIFLPVGKNESRTL